MKWIGSGKERDEMLLVLRSYRKTKHNYRIHSQNKTTQTHMLEKDLTALFSIYTFIPAKNVFTNSTREKNIKNFVYKF